MQPVSLSDRYHFLDGLRGLLALQVVLLHYVAAFAPSLSAPIPANTAISPLQSWFAGTPLFYLIDGYSAVFVFFLMSGFVLTRAFAGQEDRPLRNIGRRVVRLLIPSTGALLLAFVLFRLLPYASVDAGRLSHSVWLLSNAPGIPSIPLLLDEIFRNAAIIGYHGSSLFDFAPLRYLASPGNAATSLDAPLWTLHAELYGSLLLIVSIFLARRLPWLCVAFGIVLTLTIPCAPIYLFFVGYLVFRFEQWYLRARRIPTLSLPGYILIALGIVICGRKNFALIAMFYDWLSAHTYFVSLPTGIFEGEIGAIAIFLGVILVVRSNLPIDPIRWLLESRLAQLLGKYSFSLYLVHFPILMTVGCGFYVLLSPYLPRQSLAVAVFLIGLAITIPVTILFERWVDAAAIRASRLLKRPGTSGSSRPPANLPSIIPDLPATPLFVPSRP